MTLLVSKIQTVELTKFSSTACLVQGSLLCLLEVEIVQYSDMKTAITECLFFFKIKVVGVNVDANSTLCVSAPRLSICLLST